MEDDWITVKNTSRRRKERQQPPPSPPEQQQTLTAVRLEPRTSLTDLDHSVLLVILNVLAALRPLYALRLCLASQRILQLCSGDVRLDFSMGGGLQASHAANLATSKWFVRHFGVIGITLLTSSASELGLVCNRWGCNLLKLHLHGAVLRIWPNSWERHYQMVPSVAYAYNPSSDVTPRAALVDWHKQILELPTACPGLESMHISNVPTVTDPVTAAQTVSKLRELPNLSELQIRLCACEFDKVPNAMPWANSIQAPGQWRALNTLLLTGLLVEEIHWQASMPLLHTLVMVSEVLSSIEFNEHTLPALTKLAVPSCPKLLAVHGLQHLSQLSRLDLHGCTQLRQLDSVPPELRSLNVGSCTSLADVSKLSGCTRLESVTAVWCKCDLQSVVASGVRVIGFKA